MDTPNEMQAGKFEIWGCAAWGDEARRRRRLSPQIGCAHVRVQLQPATASPPPLGTHPPRDGTRSKDSHTPPPVACPVGSDSSATVLIFEPYAVTSTQSSLRNGL